MPPSHLNDQEWQSLLELLPADWEKAAYEQGAFSRKRQIQHPGDLLRLLFVYAWAGLSLRNTAAWAKQKQLATLSDVALLERFQKAQAWLEGLIGQMLCRRCPPPSLAEMPYQICLVDASVICQPGSKGTDWRLHLQMDAQTQRTRALQITDARGGESFTRYGVSAGDLFVGDRGYAHRAGLAHVRNAGGHVLVRFAWQNLPLQTPDALPWDLFAFLPGLAEGEIGEWAVQTAPDPKNNLPSLAGRVIALRKSTEAAEAAKRHARANAKKKGHTVDARTLLCCEFVLLFTSTPSSVLPASRVLTLYRFRWQIECGFKRLKSLLHLDALPAQEARLCRSWLYAKLLGALLVETLGSSWAAFSPWGSARNADGFSLALVSNDLALLAAGSGSGSVAATMERTPSGGTSKVVRAAA